MIGLTSWNVAVTRNGFSIVWTNPETFRTCEQFMAILEETESIDHCRTTCKFFKCALNTFIMWVLRLLAIQFFKQVRSLEGNQKEGRQTVFFTAVEPSNELLRTKWKVSRMQCIGSTSNVLRTEDSYFGKRSPANCLEKVENLNTEEIFFKSENFRYVRHRRKVPLKSASVWRIQHQSTDRAVPDQLAIVPNVDSRF